MWCKYKQERYCRYKSLRLLKIFCKFICWLQNSCPVVHVWVASQFLGITVPGRLCVRGRVKVTNAKSFEQSEDLWWELLSNDEFQTAGDVWIVYALKYVNICPGLRIPEFPFKIPRAEQKSSDHDSSFSLVEVKRNITFRQQEIFEGIFEGFLNIVRLGTLSWWRFVLSECFPVSLLFCQSECWLNWQKEFSTGCFY